MTRQRAAQNPVQLFPFLAVLVSMMGALILILLQLSRQVDRQKKTSLLAAQAPIELAPLPTLINLPTLTPTPLPPLPTLPNVLVAPVVDPRPHWQAQIDQAKDQLRLLQTTSAQDLTELQSEFDRRQRLTREERGAVIALASEVEALRSARQRQQDELDRRREKQRSDASKASSPRYSIVPYDGARGGAYRPIYLECQANAIVLQPEQVAITAHHLQDPSLPNNALARLVKAVATARDRESMPGSSYPLLIVRPAGIATYYVATAALRAIDASFGYELIPDDVALAYEPASAGIADAARAALAADVAGNEPPSGSPSRPSFLDQVESARRRAYPAPGAGAGAPTTSVAVPKRLAAIGGGGSGAESAAPNGTESPAARDDHAKVGAAAASPTSAGRDAASVETPKHLDLPISRQMLFVRPAATSDAPTTAASMREKSAETSDPSALQSASAPATFEDLLEQRQQASRSRVASSQPGAAEDGTNCDADVPWVQRSPKIPVRRAIDLRIRKGVCILHESQQTLDLHTPSAAAITSAVRLHVQRLWSDWGQPPGLHRRWQPVIRCRVDHDALEDLYHLRALLPRLGLEWEWTLVDPAPLALPAWLHGQSR